MYKQTQRPTQTQMQTYTLQGLRGWVVHGVSGEVGFFSPEVPQKSQRQVSSGPPIPEGVSVSTQGLWGALKLTISHQSQAKQPLWCCDPQAFLLQRPERPRPGGHLPRAPWPSCMGLGLESRPPGSAPIWLCSSTQGGSLGEGSGNGDDPGHGSLSLPLMPAGQATLSSRAAWCFGPGPAELPEMSPGSLQPGRLLLT